MLARAGGCSYLFGVSTAVYSRTMHFLHTCGSTEMHWLGDCCDGTSTAQGIGKPAAFVRLVF